MTLLALTILIHIVICFIGSMQAFPASGRYPQRGGMVIQGYYSNNPIFGRSHSFVPQGSMSAFLTRDAIATNSFEGKPSLIETLPEEEEEKLLPDNVDEPETSEESAQPSVINNNRRVGRKKVVKKPVVVEEEEGAEEEQEDEDEKPLRSSRKGTNIYFPITISSGNARSRPKSKSSNDENDDFYYHQPGSATAIANSYSTGKGGIATSHATSFGDPYLASMLIKNGLFNYANKKKQNA